MGVRGFRPGYEGEFPTLGHDVLAWMVEYLSMPDRSEYEPFVPTREQAEFILDWYRLDPVSGRRVFKRGVISRSKGWGKSPFLGAIALAEGLAPVLFDGWDADGRPVGKPWSEVRTPLVHLLAVSESQTRNAWTPMLEMISNGPAMDAYYGIEPMRTRINLPVGSIEFMTSSARSNEGMKPVFQILDQTEAWVPGNGGVALADTAKRNAGKINGTTIEAPNAFEPGAGSVAEQTYVSWIEQQQGDGDKDIYYNSREWPADIDFSDREAVFDGLAYAYGDSANLPGGCLIHDPPCGTKGSDFPGGWVDIPRIVSEVYDPATTLSDASRYYGNAAHADADAFIAAPEWDAARAGDDVAEVTAVDPVVLGFDGSRHRDKGVTDATVLIAMRVSDGFSWPVGIWEQPDTAAGKLWEPPEPEIVATLEEFMSSHHVVGFYADPMLWETHVSSWEAKWGSGLKTGNKLHPIRWQTNQIRRVSEATFSLRNAILDGQVVHSGSAALTRHVLNARMKKTKGGDIMYKESPSSVRKIDAAYGLMLANQARLDCLARGDLGKKRSRSVMSPVRLR